MQNVYIQVQNKLNGQTTLCLVNNANNHKAFKMTTKGHKMTTKQCLLSCVCEQSEHCSVIFPCGCKRAIVFVAFVRQKDLKCFL